MNIAKEVAQRSTCHRVKIGAVIIKDDAIVATGYVGAPRKTKDCFEWDFCLRDQQDIPSGQRYELCRSVHAEQNAIINAARAGVNLLGGTIYIWAINRRTRKLRNSFPCFICKKAIINAELSMVVCSTEGGKLRGFDVPVWQGEWTAKDIIDDVHQYGVPVK